MSRQKFPARGPRGEAVTIIRTDEQDHHQGQRGTIDVTGATYWLASGERLKPTDDPKVFEDGDGRRFTLV